MKTIQYSLADGIATITFDEPDSPVNTMCLQWQQDMSVLAAQVLQDKDAIKGVLLASAKSTFFAGADLKGAMRLKVADAGAIFTEIDLVKKNFRTLETLTAHSCPDDAASPSEYTGRGYMLTCGDVDRNPGPSWDASAHT